MNIVKLLGGSTVRLCLAGMLMLTVSGCATTLSESALVDRVDPKVEGLAEALVEGGEEEIRAAGRDLIATWVCGTDPKLCEELQ